VTGTQGPLAFVSFGSESGRPFLVNTKRNETLHEQAHVPSSAWRSVNERPEQSIRSLVSLQRCLLTLLKKATGSLWNAGVADETHREVTTSAMEPSEMPRIILAPRAGTLRGAMLVSHLVPLLGMRPGKRIGGTRLEPDP